MGLKGAEPQVEPGLYHDPADMRVQEKGAELQRQARQGFIRWAKEHDAWLSGRRVIEWGLHCEKIGGPSAEKE